MTQEQQTTAAYLTRLQNPYPGVRQGTPGVKRISFDLPESEERTMKMVRLDGATLILLVRMFARCVAQECRDQDWTFDNQKEFEDFILERTKTTKERQANGVNSTRTTDHGLSTSRLTTSESVGERPHTDVRTRTPRVRQDVQSAVHQSGNRPRKQTGEKVS